MPSEDERCCICNKIVNRLCTGKLHEGKIYCIDHYRTLILMPKMKDIERILDNIKLPEEPKGNCLKMPPHF